MRDRLTKRSAADVVDSERVRLEDAKERNCLGDEHYERWRELIVSCDPSSEVLCEGVEELECEEGKEVQTLEEGLEVDQREGEVNEKLKKGEEAEKSFQPVVVVEEGVAEKVVHSICVEELELA